MDVFEQHLRAGLELLGHELDETELAVMRVADGVYGPQLRALVEADLRGIWHEVDLDPKTRSGILTRIGFLASNATKREQHSIHRGVFVNRRIICAQLPDPPNNVPPLPPAADYKTNRERVEKHTGEGRAARAATGR